MRSYKYMHKFVEVLAVLKPLSEQARTLVRLRRRTVLQHFRSQKVVTTPMRQVTVARRTALRHTCGRHRHLCTPAASATAPRRYSDRLDGPVRRTVWRGRRAVPGQCSLDVAMSSADGSHIAEDCRTVRRRPASRYPSESTALAE